MALIRCPECNREISDKAQSCPGCGYPLSLSSSHREVNIIEKPTKIFCTECGAKISIHDRRCPSCNAINDYYEIRNEIILDVLAELNGTISTIDHKIGDFVNKGDQVIVLNSFGLNIPIVPNDPGYIHEIRVSEGDKVKKGDILFRISVE